MKQTLTRGTLTREFRRIKYKYLKKFLDQNLSVKPKNCKHNYTLNYNHPIYKTKGICTFGSNFPTEFVPNAVCEKMEDAENCPFNAFSLRFEKEKLKEEFEKLLENDEVLATHYKDLYIIKKLLEEFFPEKITLLKNLLNKWGIFKEWIKLKLKGGIADVRRIPETSPGSSSNL